MHNVFLCNSEVCRLTCSLVNAFMNKQPFYQLLSKYIYLFLPNISYSQFSRYLESLAIALEKEHWSLVQFLFSSSYSGYGISSLKKVNLLSVKFIFYVPIEWINMPHCRLVIYAILWLFLERIFLLVQLLRMLSS